MGRWGLILVSVILWTGQAKADIELEQPIACAVGTACFIQQFMDHDKTAGVRDFGCGRASYDGHKGTDYRVSPSDLRRGVEVVAAADGQVVGTRDEMPDRRIETDADRAAVTGRECGNGVLLRHAGGWETQYCHMKRGSVAVRTGDRVSAGTVLGQVGLSGKTEFPHLHLSVRKDGMPVDPFAPLPNRDTCGFQRGVTLWTDSVADAYAYQPTKVIDVGLADRALKLAGVVDGAWAGFKPLRAQPLVGYGLAMNGKPGDQLRLSLTGPDGVIASQTRDPLTRVQAQWFAFVGKKPPAGGWPTGEYTISVELIRAGRVLHSREHLAVMR